MSRSGVLVGVVGPSGAGKDTLIRRAQERLGGDPAFLFVRRLVTRPSNAFEDHDSLSTEAFESGVAEGRFPLWWRAHWLGYALPNEAQEAVTRGTVAVCNLSRSVLTAAREVFPLRVILVTAPPEVLARRLATRGRESSRDIAERVARADTDCAVPYDLEICNDRSIEDAAEQMIAFIQSLRSPATA